MKKTVLNLDAAAAFARAFFKWLAIAAVTGAVSGLVGSAFYASVASATALRETHGWLLWLLPAAGAAIALLYRLTKLGGALSFVDHAVEHIQQALQIFFFHGIFVKQRSGIKLPGHL